MNNTIFNARPSGWDVRDVGSTVADGTLRAGGWIHTGRQLSVLVSLEDHEEHGRWLHLSASLVLGRVQIAPTDEEWAFVLAAFGASGREDNRESRGTARHLWQRVDARETRRTRRARR